MEDTIKDNDYFMTKYVDLHKETMSVLLKALDKEYEVIDDVFTKSLSRDEAIIGGILVKIYKLNMSILENICSKKMEIVSILDRCLSEAIINFKYLTKAGPKNNFDEYLKYSYIAEKKLHTQINNDESPNSESIRNRMKSSLAKMSNITGIDINNIERSTWPNVKDKINHTFDDITVGNMFYNIYYGAGSHGIHTNWTDIYFNHLDVKEKDNFTLKFSWVIPKPQVYEMTIFMTIYLINDLISLNYYKNETDKIKDELKNIYDTFTLLAEEHELSLK
jgi:hypothetical protein